MKRIFIFLAVATFTFFATNCGGGSGSGSGGSNSPANIQKSIFSQMQKGNYAKAVEIMIDNLEGKEEAEGTEMLQAFTEKAKQSAESKGGLKSFEIISEIISEDGLTATVTSKLVYGNGKEETEKSKYVNKDGKWKLSFGK